jgi:hypothetical protein
MKLYYSPRACSLSPHVVLREAEIDADLENVDLKEQARLMLAQHPDDLLLAEPASFHRPSPFRRRTLPQTWLSFRGADHSALTGSGKVRLGYSMLG